VDAGSTTSQARVVAGRYRLLDPVGSGGMGTVWRAEDERLGRLVAVKEVRPPAGMTGPEYDDLRERTLREARAAARLSTPGAVAVHDVVEEDGRPYVVMELLPGRSLAEVVADGGPLASAEVARVGLSLVATLAAAHRAGILHRDVKPANVVLAEGGRVVLTDFGIAKAAGDPQLTSTGVLLGSPAYIAPERARGEEAGPPSDLFALGATLFTAVEGRPPFAGPDAMATLLAVVAGRREPVRAAGPLGPVLTRLLDPDPARRPTAAQAERLLRAAADQARTAPPSPAAPARTAPAQPSLALPAQERTLVVPVPMDAAAGPPRPPGAADRHADRHPAPQRRTAPATRPAASRARGRGGLRPAPVLALLGLLAVLALGAGAVWATRDTGPPAPAAAPADTGTTGTTPPDGSGAAGEGDAVPPEEAAAETGETERASGDEQAGDEQAGDEQASTPEDSPSQDTPADASEPALATEGWMTYADEAGWSLAHPEGWEPEERNVRGQRVVQITSPEGGGRYIRVSDDGRASGDPADRWQAFAQEFAARNPSYEEVGIETVEDYPYTPAADWEFTYSSGGAELHVLDRMLFTDDGRAYAVLVQGRDDDDVRDVFDQVVESFRPPAARG
jgi:tRNA A-37 threonylcarbamoyl transferase component Bud32